ncbi:hypothetical protein [Gloeocapsa sp. PCC 73106]|uniref:hypothetical protein n=1 Tax=Gloeocapsa sp. PCC 73106 TaxID=102232 RepID=UPI0005515DBD|nr:hypothetical protein [Gloeocapsa sp. PCC 73106]
MVERGLILPQQQVDYGSNEITVISELIKNLAIARSDARCEKAIIPSSAADASTTGSSAPGSLMSWTRTISTPRFRRSNPLMIVLAKGILKNPTLKSREWEE